MNFSIAPLGASAAWAVGSRARFRFFFVLFCFLFFFSFVAGLCGVGRGAGLLVGWLCLVACLFRSPFLVPSVLTDAHFLHPLPFG